MTVISILPRLVRGAVLLTVALVFLFPIGCIVLMSFETQDQIVQLPPLIAPHPTLANYLALVSGKLHEGTAIVAIPYRQNLWSTLSLSCGAVVLTLLTGIPAALMLARYRFRVGRNIVRALWSLSFAPPLLVLFPLSRWFGNIPLISVYPLICLPPVLLILRRRFADADLDVRYAYRLDGHSWWRTFTTVAVPLAAPGIAAAGLLAFILVWNNMICAMILAPLERQTVATAVLALATASGVPYGVVAAAIVISILPVLALGLAARRWLAEALSLGAIRDAS